MTESTRSFTPHFALTPLIQRQLLAIDACRGFLEAVRLQGEWGADLKRKARVQDALSSVQIEGNSLTYAEAFELAHTPPDRELRDSEREFLNYLNAFDALDSLAGNRNARITRADLQNLHKLLVDGVRGGHRFAGQLRRETVTVGDREGDEIVVHHQPPHWGDLEPLLTQLFDWIGLAKEKPTHARLTKGIVDTWVHPVIVAGIAQHRLVWIHPFVDGNGRSARMLTTLLLYQRGYDFKYLFDLSSYYERNRDKYYEALRAVDRTGDYTPWLQYFLGGLASQMMRIRSTAMKAAGGLASAAEPRGGDQPV